MTEPAAPLFADRYEIRRRLGAGGAGEVYEAVARSASGFTRRVALKLLVDPADGEAGLEAFREEARVASRLHHGGIVGIVDFGVAGGAPFLVLELVDGLSAATAAERARARGRAMPVGVALAICVDVARALHHAHEAKDDAGRALGIVHRDVKPSNVLLSWEGDVKLGDFGIARSDDRVRRTTDGFAKGTPGYMAPEQLAGAPVDARADVFALGCMLHAFVAGRSPASSTDGMVRLLSGAPLDVDRALDDDVRALVTRAVAPRPSERHPTALAFAEEAARAMARRLARDPRGELATFLATLRDGAAAPGGPPPRLAETVLTRVGATDAFEPAATKIDPARAARSSGARTFAAAAAATLALGATFALGGAATWWWASRRAPPSPVAPPPPLTDTEPAVADAARPAPLAAVSEAPSPAPDPPDRPRAPRGMRPEALGPAWTRFRAHGRHCACVIFHDDAFGGSVEQLCRAIVAPRCACWAPSVTDRNRELLCHRPPQKDGSCPNDGDLTGQRGEPCEGYAPRGDGSRLSGTKGCSTCDGEYGDGYQTDPCTGVVAETGARKKGILKCSVD